MEKLIFIMAVIMLSSVAGIILSVIHLKSGYWSKYNKIMKADIIASLTSSILLFSLSTWFLLMH